MKNIQINLNIASKEILFTLVGALILLIGFRILPLKADVSSDLTGSCVMVGTSSRWGFIPGTSNSGLTGSALLIFNFDTKKVTSISNGIDFDNTYGNVGGSTGPTISQSVMTLNIDITKDTPVSGIYTIKMYNNGKVVSESNMVSVGSGNYVGIGKSSTATSAICQKI
jgi:hypothetical protein